MDANEISAEIEANEKIIARSRSKVGYLNGLLYLIQLQGIATCVVPRMKLQTYRDKLVDGNKMFIFENNCLSELKPSEKAYLIISNGIKRHNTITGSDNNPDWSRKALRQARIVDSYRFSDTATNYK